MIYKVISVPLYFSRKQHEYYNIYCSAKDPLYLGIKGMYICNSGEFFSLLNNQTGTHT